MTAVCLGGGIVGYSSFSFCWAPILLQLSGRNGVIRWVVEFFYWVATVEG